MPAEPPLTFISYSRDDSDFALRLAADLKAAGYNGEKVVLLAATDFPVLKAMSDVVADMLQRSGLNVDYIATDIAGPVQAIDRLVTSASATIPLPPAPTTHVCCTGLAVTVTVYDTPGASRSGN